MHILKFGWAHNFEFYTRHWAHEKPIISSALTLRETAPARSQPCSRLPSDLHQVLTWLTIQMQTGNQASNAVVYKCGPADLRVGLLPSARALGSSPA